MGFLFDGHDSPKRPYLAEVISGEIVVANTGKMVSRSESPDSLPEQRRAKEER